MNWNQSILAITTVMVIILAIITIKPFDRQVTDVREPASLKITSSTEVSLSYPFSVTGLSISGSFRGTGFGQVWLVGEGRKYLIFDTDSLSPATNTFNSACGETCSIPPIHPEKLLFAVTGGTLAIDEYHLAVPSEPIGLAICPDCKRVTQSQTPDHSLFMLVVLLFVTIVGAHAVSHFSTTPFVKYSTIGVLIITFILLSIIFGFSLAAPTTAIATDAKFGASVLSAAGILFLFIIGAIEVKKTSHEVNPTENVWRALEEVEDEWDRKK